MFEYCRFVDRACAFAGMDHKNEKRCGMGKGDNNYVDTMTTCPLSDNREKLESRESWKLKHYTVVELKKQADIKLKEKRKKIEKILDL
jgi:hypothetical protein